jgi:hypothetical protein
MLDLAGFDSGASVQYSGNKSGGTVTVSEANHTTAILKVGANSGNWTAPVSDGHGGILIHDPPATDSPATTDSNEGSPTPFHNVIAGKPTGDSVWGGAGGDGFVFRPNLGKDAVPDGGHGEGPAQLDHLGVREVMPLLLAANDDAHGQLSFAHGSHDPILADSVKAQLLAHHTGFHVV